MGCRSPKVYSQPYMIPGAAPSTATDRYVLIDIHDEQEFAAIEIDCSSEIDCCIVSHKGGLAFLTIGSPAVGPLVGPLQVMPWRRVLPYGPEVQGFTAEPLLTKAPPILAVKVHYAMPPWFQQRRGPAFRSAPDYPTAVGYETAAEFPLYGFARGRLTLISAAASTVYKVQGVHYRARIAATEQAGDPISTLASPTMTQLVLDGTGAVERTVASGATESLDLEGEPFDTILVSVKQGSGAGSARLSWRTEGEA